MVAAAGGELAAAGGVVAAAGGVVAAAGGVVAGPAGETWAGRRRVARITLRRREGLPLAFPGPREQVDRHHIHLSTAVPEWVDTAGPGK